MDTVKPWRSKTVIVNSIIAIAGLLAMWGIVPQIKEWLDGHSDVLLMAVGAVGIALRAATSGKLSIE